VEQRRLPETLGIHHAWKRQRELPPGQCLLKPHVQMLENYASKALRETDSSTIKGHYTMRDIHFVTVCDTR
jgi:hypothetical protein